MALNLVSFLAIAFFSGTILTAAFLFLYIAVNYSMTVGLAKARQTSRRKQIYCACLGVNIGCFFFLQHKGFIGVLDSKNASAPSTVPLLMGYAFYALQAVAIQGAVFRRVIFDLDFQRYALAVSFCGAFLAGPVFNQEQLKKFKDLEVALPTPTRIYKYLHVLIGAFAFKYVFANWLSQWVTTQEALSPLLIARTVLCFELQVYFDFAGYSLLSFFLCRIFGIPIYHNFQHPFAAQNIPEFWRRWHVGLGTFFKENVFLPLRAVYPQRLATRVILPMTVFLLSALWHGPTRNFILWGLLHGGAFVVSVAILKRWNRMAAVRLGAKISVFIVLFYGRLLFMESDFDLLMEKFRGLGRFQKMGRDLWAILSAHTQLSQAFLQHWDGFVVGGAMVLILAYEVFFIKHDDRRCYRYLRPGIWAFIVLLFTLLFFQPANHAGFVYGR
ncbi:MBOAT family O-acyltransferase [Oligoflexus tunisiensis]|uniref:MBOAT family O-acyltransferase n=1 Tax=Oligoflexus tunisiensis TaxID=708132 RepID=UPI001C408747|nr:MBOAT family O-acyltransferase [Oligoflexus tunisiensis]